jgi:N-acetylmuramoyl-L-alanine amidase CwlA
MTYGGVYWAQAYCGKCGYIRNLEQETRIDPRGVRRHKYNSHGRVCNNPVRVKPNPSKCERSKQRNQRLKAERGAL